MQDFSRDIRRIKKPSYSIPNVLFDGRGQEASDTSPSYDESRHTPLELVSMSGKASLKARLQSLEGRCIVFFCAGYPGKRFIYNIAKKRGVKSIIIDNHDSWARELVISNVISYFIGVDMTASPDEVLRQSLVALADIPLKPDGVCTFVELSVSISSRLASALGCPGPNPESVDSARDKFKARQVFKAFGLPHVANTIISSDADLERASEAIGFPAVLKPISGAASLGVQKVNTKEELLSAYRNVSSTLSNLVVSAGALERRTESIKPDSLPSPGVDARAVIDVTVMMEEYLDGPEVDVDMIFSGGKCRYSNVIDNGPTFEPYFAETWAALPSLMDPSKVEELQYLAEQAVVALGFTDGVFHVELKYTSKGPRLIEVNARMGGAGTRMIHKLVAGIDLVVEQFFIAVGIPSRPLIPRVPLIRVAYAFINSRATGAVEDVSFIGEYASREHVVWVNTYVKPFEQVIGPQDGLPTWLGDVVVAHPDGHEALRIVKAIEKEISDDFLSRRIPGSERIVEARSSHNIC